jgi:hypothetical protein
MSEPLPILSRSYYEILINLHEAGGSGRLDMHGRVIVPPNHPIAGNALSWLKLVARGLVAGEGDMICTTAFGREEAERIIKGRTREAM